MRNLSVIFALFLGLHAYEQWGDWNKPHGDVFCHRWGGVYCVDTSKAVPTWHHSKGRK